MPRHLPLTAAMLMSLAGCALPIAPARSGMTPPLRFVASPFPPEAATTDPAWWRGFASPELDRLMAGAMAGNLDIASAIARLAQADAQVRIVGAQLLPSLDAGASLARARGTNATPGAPANAGRQYGGSLAAGYEIDFWGRLAAQRQSAESSAIAAAFDIGVLTLTTQSAVATTLFDLIGAQEQLAIQGSNLEIANRNLGILRQRLAAGTSTGLDVAQQEAVVATQRGQIPPLQQAVEANTFALATLTGVLPGDIAIAAQGLTTIVVPRIDPGLPSDLLLRRPDVRRAEADLAAANADVTAARGALFPTITLTAEGGLQSLALQTLLRPGATLYSIAAGISQPIFDGGQRRAQLAQTRARQDELVAAYRLAILSALQDTETSLSAVQRNSELVVLQMVRVDAAQRAFNIADAQLRAGTIDLLIVLNTQTTLFNARLALAQAQASRLRAAASLFTALGGGWSPQGLRFAQAGSIR